MAREGFKTSRAAAGAERDSEKQQETLLRRAGVISSSGGEEELAMKEKPVFIFGAGASKACGGPLTDEILYNAFCNDDLRATLERPKDVDIVRDCLQEHFHAPKQCGTPSDYPSLTLLLSLLDLSIERNRPLPRKKPDFPKGLGRLELTRARAAIEYIIFAVLDYHLRMPIGSAYRNLLASPLIDPEVGPQAISLNYDIILD